MSKEGRVEELNKTMVELVNTLLTTSIDKYNKIKFTLLAQRDGDPVVDDYLTRLFEFTDRHRPRLIGMK